MFLRVIFFLSILFATLSVLAQPSPCSDTSSMTPLCMDACIVCDIDGYTGINNDGITGQAPPGFCTSTVHHMQWIAFMAGSTNLTLQVSVFNCQNNDGLEVGIYLSTDCQNFELVSNCDGDVPENSSQLFTNTQPLVIGQYYYFVMDGNMGDVCSYTIDVVSGSTLVDPLISSGPVLGNLTSCTGVPQTYVSPGVPGATAYLWTLDGVNAGTNDTLELLLDEPGTYQLCMTASNVCNAAPPTCQIITVSDPLPTLLTASICEGDCYAVSDTLICDPGNYEFHYLLDNGCDSTVILQLDYLPTAVTNLNFNICEGDSIYIAGVPYFSAGQYQEIVSSVNQCDSIINLELGMVICQIQSSLSVQAVACSGGNTGYFTFQVENGTPPFIYNWQHISNTSLNGSGNIIALGETHTISNLPQGTYITTITDGFGNQDIIIAEITAPEPLEITINAASYNGYGVSCFNGNDGALSAIATGGTPPFSYSWDNGATDANINGLTAGTYLLTVTDFANCTITASYTITQPAGLEVDAQFQDPDCSGPASGIITGGPTSGGVPPYLYSIDNSNFVTENVFQSLSAGNYTLVVQDENGCVSSVTGQLNSLEIPVISAGPDQTINLGEQVVISVQSNIIPASVVWNNIPGLSCYDCLQPLANPYINTAYEVQVTSVSGCTDVDTILVSVNRISDIYVPNIFSPNDDGINDFVQIFSGISVKEIIVMEVYTRWGELVWSASNFQPNQPTTGWNGYYRNKKMDAGVFAWYLEAELLDGYHVFLEGDITLVRN